MQVINQLKAAIQQNPNNPALFYDLGGAYLAEMQIEDAVASYKQALHLAPNHPQVLLQLGNATSLAGLFTVAADYFKQCINVNPNNAAAHYNLGNTLRELGQLKEAVSSYLTTLKLTPNDADTYNNLGNVYRELGLLDKAINCYQTALKHNPNLYHALAHLIHQKQHICDWQNLDEEIYKLKQALTHEPKAQIAPFAFLAMPGTTMQEQLQCANQWANQQFLALFKRQKPYPYIKIPAKNKIKIGYLSSDFRLHPLAFLITEMLTKHDRHHFEIVAFSASHDDSLEQRNIASAVDMFVNIESMNDVQAADIVYAHQIDILIDLTGYTKNSRSGIIALKPAPISINWLGFPGTMGQLKNQTLYDYIIVDKVIAPDTKYFSEQCLYLPCYQPNNCKRPVAKMTAKSNHLLPEKAFVFCCFNQTFKITSDIFAIWMQLLKNVPNSVLWLLECNPWAKHNLHIYANEAGVDAARIIFAPRLPIDEHLERHVHADLFLDTLPYNAHTTASDALYMNLPIVTCMGDTFASRVTASLLNQVQLNELISQNLSDYYQIAYRLATQPKYLQNMVNQLQKNKSFLFNQTTFLHNLEQTYRSIYNAL